MDDYIAFAIPRIQDQLHHVANALMKGIHNVLPPYKDDYNDVIYLKKFLIKEGA